jgi:hypothetical protein
MHTRIHEQREIRYEKIRKKRVDVLRLILSRSWAGEASYREAVDGRDRVCPISPITDTGPDEVR